MKYLHQVTDQNGEVKETQYSNFRRPKLSLECLAIAKKGEYKIWDRFNNWKEIEFEPSLLSEEFEKYSKDYIHDTDER